MEKKKLLLVAVSVGVFLIIVIGLSILIFLPKNKESRVSAQVVSRGVPGGSTDTGIEGISIPGTGINPERLSSSIPEMERREPATVDAVDMLRNREDLQGLKDPPAFTGLPGNNGSNLVIEVPRPTSVAIPNSTAAGRTSSGLNVNPEQSARIPVQPPSPSIPVTQTRASGSSSVAGSVLPAASKPPTVIPAALKPPAQSTRMYEDYWVQAGSFSTQVRAEDVKDTLAAKGITAIIENRDVKGKNVFRVRIGPYTSQQEADYWLAFIKTINGFEGSQIWQSRSER